MVPAMLIEPSALNLVRPAETWPLTSGAAGVMSVEGSMKISVFHWLTAAASLRKAKLRGARAALGIENLDRALEVGRDVARGHVGGGDGRVVGGLLRGDGLGRLQVGLNLDGRGLLRRTVEVGDVHRLGRQEVGAVGGDRALGRIGDLVAAQEEAASVLEIAVLVGGERARAGERELPGGGRRRADIGDHEEAVAIDGEVGRRVRDLKEPLGIDELAHGRLDTARRERVRAARAGYQRREFTAGPFEGGGVHVGDVVGDDA